MRFQLGHNCYRIIRVKQRFSSFCRKHLKVFFGNDPIFIWRNDCKMISVFSQSWKTFNHLILFDNNYRRENEHFDLYFRRITRVHFLSETIG